MISGQEILISVVIPVKNGGPWLEATLKGIFNQTLINQTEVIIIDSGSTDNTMNILKRFPVKRISIEPNEFNHGETRNVGVRAASGKYVVMTVQDAVPSDEHWLQELLNGFDDENVAGVCGLQIVPHDLDKNPIMWFRPLSQGDIKRYSFSDIALFEALTPEEKRNICRWDDVNAMYRKDILLSLPFRRVAFAEDVLWSIDAITNGYHIVYNSKAKVMHYHHEDPDYTLRRSFTENYHFFKFFGLKPVSNSNEVLDIVKNIRLLVKEKRISWKNKRRWLIFNYKHRQAVKRSIDIFNGALAKSEQELEVIHQNICGVTPQAVNVSNISA